MADVHLAASRSVSISLAFSDHADDTANVADPVTAPPQAVVPVGFSPSSIQETAAPALQGVRDTKLAIVYNYKTSRGRAFLKDSAAARETLPKLLPKGLPYAANYVSFGELTQRGVLSTLKRDEVSITADHLRLLYQAKCVDQALAPSWEREVRFMELISANCRGNFFSLPENGFGPASAEAIKHVLSVNWRYSVLDLSGNRLGDEGACSIADLLAVNRALVHIGLSSNNVGHAGGIALAKALEKNNTVISLDLGAKFGMNGNHIGSTGARAMAHLLKTNQVLWKLSLGSNGLGPAGIALVADGLLENTHLTHLDLSGNNLGPEGAATVASILDRGVLKWLSLQRNALGDRGGKAIFEAIISLVEGTGFDSLEYLDVESNDMGPLAAKAIGRAISVSTTLRTLKLSANLFSAGSGITASKCLADGVCDNKGLLSLSLSNCGFREADGAAFGHLLAHNAVLTALDLSNNKFKDQGARDIARGLAANRALTKMNLSSNKIGDDGGKEVAESLSSNISLRELNMRRNAMCIATGELFSEVLRGNTSIEKVNVSYNDFSYKSTIAIQATLERNAKSNKLLVVPRLNGEIESLAPNERELAQVEEEIDMKKRIIKDRSEQMRRRSEEARVVLEKLRRDVHELDKQAERVRASCEVAEDAFRRTEERLTNASAALKGKSTNMEARTQQERDRVDRLHRETDKMRRQIKQIEDAENEHIGSLLADLAQTRTDCTREQQDAKFEAEKLATLAVRKKELEIMLSSLQGKKPR